MDEKLSGKLNSNKEKVLISVKENGRFLAFIDEFKNDKEIVLAAVDQNGDYLEFASNDLKNDKEVVMAAIKSGRLALRYASNELRGDKGVAIAAVKNWGGSLRFASKKLRGDKEVVMEAIKNDIWALEFASDDLRLDKEVVLTALNNSPYTYRNCDVLIQRNLDIIKFTDSKFKLLGESIEDYLCGELIDLKEKYGVDTLVLALEMEAAEIECEKLSSNVVNVGLVSGFIKRF